MACNLMTRLFRRRRQAPAAFTTPALPTSTVRLEDTTDLAPELGFEKLRYQEDADFFYLGCLTQQGSFTLVLPEVPVVFDTTSTIARLRSLPGFTSWYCASRNSNEYSDLVFVFSTAADAAMALATQPPIDVGNGLRRNLQYSQDEQDDCPLPLRKRMKFEQPPLDLPTCCICADTIDGAFSTPCLACKKAWCHECLHSQFRSALGDHERFPARCCGRVMHYDVVREILPPPDYQLYKTRFEEHNTSAPVYCANLLCSAFLPPRVASVDDKGMVRCHKCYTKTCIECREVVEGQNHKCVTADATTALLEQFSYKRCRRCRAGIAKMFGCSHVRCQCGAHWCWDCQRPIQMCWSRPCERAQEDGDYGYDDELPDDDESISEDTPHTETQQTAEQAIADERELEPVVSHEAVSVTVVEEPQGLVTTVPEDVPDVSQDQNLAVPIEPAEEATRAPAIAVPTEPVVNLDDEGLEDWEATSMYFGDEPTDESWDTWGCLHSFGPMHRGTVWKEHKHWIATSTQTIGGREVTAKLVDCQKCYTPITILSASDFEVQKTAGSHERVDSACDVGQLNIQMPEGAGVDEAKNRKKKAKSKRPQPDLFSCLKCGLCFCSPCKRRTIKEMKQLSKEWSY